MYLEKTLLPESEGKPDSQKRPRLRRRYRSSPGEITFDVANILCMLLICFLFLYPFWYVLAVSLNEGLDARRGPIYWFPRKFTLENYGFVIRNPRIISATVVTVARAVVFPIFSVFITMLAAYALSKRDIPGRRGILFFYLVPLFIGGTVVTHYLVIAKVGLLDNFLVYILPASFSFFNMVIMRTFVEQIPDSLEESAMMDGAGYFTRFVRIVVPLSKPVLAVFLFFGVVYAWLDFRTNLLYVTNRRLNVLQFVLYEMVIQSQAKDYIMDMSGSQSIDQMFKGDVTPKYEVLKMATLVVVTFPIFFVYPFFQKFFVKGIMVGAIKA